MSEELNKEQRKRNGIIETCNTICDHLDEFNKLSIDIQTKELTIDEYEELFDLMMCHLDCATLASETLGLAPRIIDSVTPNEEDMNELNRLIMLYEVLNTRINDPSAIIRIN